MTFWEFGYKPVARRGRVAVWILACAALAALGCGGGRRSVVRAVELPLLFAPDPLPEPEQPKPEPRAVHHTVAPGETLWRIARNYGVALEELARANGIDDPRRVAAGARLRVPGPAPTAAVPPAVARATAGSGFVWPVSGGRILSGFGAQRRTHRHKGLDIDGRRGQPVLAAEGGVVVYSGAGMRGYGKTIIIDHGNALRSLYAHNSALLARHGQQVRRGEVIARVGRSGNATTEHCHFEIRRNDQPVNPLDYLGRTEGRP